MYERKLLSVVDRPISDFDSTLRVSACQENPLLADAIRVPVSHAGWGAGQRDQLLAAPGRPAQECGALAVISTSNPTVCTFRVLTPRFLLAQPASVTDSTSSPPAPPPPLPPPQPDSELHIEPDVQSHLEFFLRFSPSLSTSPRLAYSYSLFSRFLTQNLLPDQFTFYGRTTPLYAVKALKFLTVVLLWMYFTNAMVKKFDIEHDEDYNLKDFLRFDCHPILLDMFAFFVVGRLAYRRGVDCVCFLLPLTFGTWFLSWVTTFPDLQQSFTMYGLACEWTVVTFLTFGAVFFVLAIIGVLHVRTGWREGILFGRILELLFVTALIVTPVIQSPDFHIHHWYSAWLLGMHINYRQYWSFATMGFCIGVYINGIGVYGRDSILGCEEDAYRITNDGCGWWNPGVEAQGAANMTPWGRRRMQEDQDWHNCPPDSHDPNN